MKKLKNYEFLRENQETKLNFTFNNYLRLKQFELSRAILHQIKPKSEQFRILETKLLNNNEDIYVKNFCLSELSDRKTREKYYLFLFEYELLLRKAFDLGYLSRQEAQELDELFILKLKDEKVEKIIIYSRIFSEDEDEPSSPESATPGAGDSTKISSEIVVDGVNQLHIFRKLLRKDLELGCYLCELLIQVSSDMRTDLYEMFLDFALSDVRSPELMVDVVNSLKVEHQSEVSEALLVKLEECLKRISEQLPRKPVFGSRFVNKLYHNLTRHLLTKEKLYLQFKLVKRQHFLSYVVESVLSHIEVRNLSEIENLFLNHQEYWRIKNLILMISFDKLRHRVQDLEYMDKLFDLLLVENDQKLYSHCLHLKFYLDFSRWLASKILQFGNNQKNIPLSFRKVSKFSLENIRMIVFEKCYQQSSIPYIVLPFLNLFMQSELYKNMAGRETDQLIIRIFFVVNNFLKNQMLVLGKRELREFRRHPKFQLALFENLYSLIFIKTKTYQFLFDSHPHLIKQVLQTILSELKHKYKSSITSIEEEEEESQEIEEEENGEEEEEEEKVKKKKKKMKLRSREERRMEIRKSQFLEQVERTDFKLDLVTRFHMSSGIVSMLCSPPITYVTKALRLNRFDLAKRVDKKFGLGQASLIQKEEDFHLRKKEGVEDADFMYFFDLFMCTDENDLQQRQQSEEPQPQSEEPQEQEQPLEEEEEEIQKQEQKEDKTVGSEEVLEDPDRLLDISCLNSMKEQFGLDREAEMKSFLDRVKNKNFLLEIQNSTAVRDLKNEFFFLGQLVPFSSDFDFEKLKIFMDFPKEPKTPPGMVSHMTASQPSSTTTSSHSRTSSHGSSFVDDIKQQQLRMPKELNFLLKTFIRHLFKNSQLMSQSETLDTTTIEVETEEGEEQKEQDKDVEEQEEEQNGEESKRKTRIREPVDRKEFENKNILYTGIKKMICQLVFEEKKFDMAKQLAQINRLNLLKILWKQLISEDEQQQQKTASGSGGGGGAVELSSPSSINLNNNNKKKKKKMKMMIKDSNKKEDEDLEEEEEEDGLEEEKYNIEFLNLQVLEFVSQQNLLIAILMYVLLKKENDEQISNYLLDRSQEFPILHTWLTRWLREDGGGGPETSSSSSNSQTTTSSTTPTSPVMLISNELSFHKEKIIRKCIEQFKVKGEYLKALELCHKIQDDELSDRLIEKLVTQNASKYLPQLVYRIKDKKLMIQLIFDHVEELRHISSVIEVFQIAKENSEPGTNDEYQSGIKLKQFLLYKEILSHLKFKSWRELHRKIHHGLPELIRQLNKINRYELSRRLLKFFDHSNELFIDIEKDFLLSKLLHPRMNTTKLLHILVTYKPSDGLEICESMLENQELDYEKKIFICNFVITALRKELSKEQVDMFENILMGLKIFQQLQNKNLEERFKHLIYYPNLIIENLIMLREISHVAKILRVVEINKIMQDPDNMFLRYGVKALDLHSNRNRNSVITSFSFQPRSPIKKRKMVMDRRFKKRKKRSLSTSTSTSSTKNSKKTKKQTSSSSSSMKRRRSRNRRKKRKSMMRTRRKNGGTSSTGSSGSKTSTTNTSEFILSGTVVQGEESFEEEEDDDDDDDIDIDDSEEESFEEEEFEDINSDEESEEEQQSKNNNKKKKKKKKKMYAHDEDMNASSSSFTFSTYFKGNQEEDQQIRDQFFYINTPDLILAKSLFDLVSKPKSVGVRLLRFLELMEFNYREINSSSTTSSTTPSTPKKDPSSSSVAANNSGTFQIHSIGFSIHTQNFRTLSVEIQHRNLERLELAEKLLQYSKFCFLKDPEGHQEFGYLHSVRQRMKLLKFLIYANACTHMQLTLHLLTDKNKLRQIRDHLIKNDFLKLALKICRISGVETTPVLMEWGLLLLRLENYQMARVKFEECSRRRADRHSVKRMLDEILRILQEKAYLFEKSGSAITTSDRRRNKNNMEEEEEIEEEDQSNNNKRRRKSQKKSKSLHHQQQKQGSNGTLSSSSKSSSTTIRQKIMDEAKYYLHMYGKGEAYLRFFLDMNEIEIVLDYCFSSSTSSSSMTVSSSVTSSSSSTNDNNKSMMVNINEFKSLVLPYLYDYGLLKQFKERVRKTDKGLKKYHSYLHAICKFLHRISAFHLLYDFQLFMKDEMRCGYTCIQIFIQEHKKLYESSINIAVLENNSNEESDIFNEEGWKNCKLLLARGKQHFIKAINSKKLRSEQRNAEYVSSCIMTINFQMELLKMELIQHTTSTDPNNNIISKTLFTSNKDRIAIVEDLILFSKDRKLNSLALKIMSEYNLKPTKIFRNVMRRLVLARASQKEINLVLEPILRGGGLMTLKEHEKDDLVLQLIMFIVDFYRSQSTAAKMTKMAERFIIKIRSYSKRISAYMECGRYKYAYKMATERTQSAGGERIGEKNVEKNLIKLMRKDVQGIYNFLKNIDTKMANNIKDHSVKWLALNKGKEQHFRDYNK